MRHLFYSLHDLDQDLFCDKPLLLKSLSADSVEQEPLHYSPSFLIISLYKGTMPAILSPIILGSRPTVCIMSGLLHF